MSEPAPELPADTLVTAMDNASHGVVTHITIDGERVAAIIPESLLETTARLVQALVSREDPAGLPETLAAALPWARLLPSHELEAFARELREAIVNATPKLMETVNDITMGWAATASIYADPDLAEALRAPAEDCGPVPEPSRG
jgi:hypothetical protein